MSSIVHGNNMLIKALFSTFILAFVALLTRSIRLLYFEPLSRFPGPRLWAAFRWPMLRTMWKGNLPFRIKELHDRYGPVVRIGSDELSFISEDAWRSIYGSNYFDRPPQWRGRFPGATGDSFVSAQAHTHARLRRVFAPAFSEKAIRGYEPSIHRHLDALVGRLHACVDVACDVKNGDKRVKVDIARWLNLFLFDTMMEIGWSRTFNLLQKGDYHPWVTAMHGYEERILGACLNYYPWLRALANALMPESTKRALQMIWDIAEDNVSHRLRTGSTKRDILFNTLGSKMSVEDAGITHEEMVMNSMTYVVVGSEPVTTVLAGILSYLVQPAYERVKDILTREIREAMSDSASLSSESVARQPYLTAVLKEGLRLCPPIPDCMRRLVPAPGAVIAGEAIPAGTTVSVSCWATFTSDTHFSSPEKLIPERWLDQPAEPGGASSVDFEDQRGVFYPFSRGHRGCMGQSLAWLELRLTLCRLLLEFDIGPAEDQKLTDWRSQKILWEWVRQPVFVNLTPVVARDPVP